MKEFPFLRPIAFILITSLLALSFGCGVSAPSKGVIDTQRSDTPFFKKSGSGRYIPIVDEPVIVETTDGSFYRCSEWVYRSEGFIECVAMKYQTLEASNLEQDGILFEGTIEKAMIKAIYKPGWEFPWTYVLIGAGAIGLILIVFSFRGPEY